jgi:prepilin-type N-terminal cleavage/methylation domain-containing protein
MSLHQQQGGFTLAELLIALAILGVVATFTIPKVLSGQQNSKFRAIAKESAGMISEEYLLYKTRNPVDANTSVQDVLGSFMNYVKLDTSSTLDATPNDGSPTLACNNTDLCYRLHNGSIIWTYELSFAGTSNTNAVYFVLDPDGEVSGRQDSVTLFLYYDGKIRTWQSVIPNSSCSDGTIDPNPAGDPAWFEWN